MDRAARDGLGALFAVMRDLDDYPTEVGRFNAIRAESGLPPIPTKIAAFIYCADSRAQAEEEGLEYVVDYMNSLEDHYHWASSDKYKKIDSYQFYANLGEQRSKVSEAETIESLLKNPNSSIRWHRHTGVPGPSGHGADERAPKCGRLGVGAASRRAVITDH